MPQKPEDRDYKKEYKNYHGKPEQIANRSKRNKARRKMEKKGRVSKGDGKEVDHRMPLSKGGSNDASNLGVMSRSANRRKGANGKSRGSRSGSSGGRKSKSSISGGRVSNRRNSSGRPSARPRVNRKYSSPRKMGSKSGMGSPKGEVQGPPSMQKKINL